MRIKLSGAHARRHFARKGTCGLISLILAVLVIIPADAPGQEAGLPEVNLIHWAYAAAFGTGIYQFGDSATTYVFRIRPKIKKTFSFESHLGGRKFYFDIRLPITLGLHDFDLSNIEDLLSIDFQQVSFTPGVMLQVPLRENWDIQLFANVGAGTELKSSRNSALIYWGGINSQLAFHLFRTDFALLNSISSYGHNPSNGGKEAISSLITGLEWNPRLGKTEWGGEPLYLNTIVWYYYYFQGLDILWNPNRDPVSLSWEWEIGLSLNKKTPFRLWFLSFQRLGIGYRFSPNSHGIRFFTSAVFY